MYFNKHEGINMGTFIEKTSSFFDASFRDNVNENSS